MIQKPASYILGLTVNEALRFMEDNGYKGAVVETDGNCVEQSVSYPTSVLRLKVTKGKVSSYQLGPIEISGVEENPKRGKSCQK